MRGGGGGWEGLAQRAGRMGGMGTSGLPSLREAPLRGMPLQTSGMNKESREPGPRSPIESEKGPCTLLIWLDSSSYRFSESGKGLA